MIEIDGSQGEGGGQIFRTTLTLAMCLGLPVRIYNIRAGRARPGLLRQHLACLRAAREISDAVVAGETLGASEVTFTPGRLKPGKYHFAVGSAGSTTLVFQTLLLPLLVAGEESEVVFEGGTHNGMAPSLDFIEYCFLPLLRAIGGRVDISLESFGFYPSGGGRWSARIFPLADTSPLYLLERGEMREFKAVATSANIPSHVNERELDHVRRKCLLPEASLQSRLVKSPGQGNILSLRVSTETVTEVFESVGERNVSAEQVAGRAVRDLNRYLRADVPVGEHLADQLLLPLLLTGGAYRTLQPSSHLLTNIEVVRVLSGLTVEKIELGEDRWEVRVPRLEMLAALQR